MSCGRKKEKGIPPVLLFLSRIEKSKGLLDIGGACRRREDELI